MTRHWVHQPFFMALLLFSHVSMVSAQEVNKDSTKDTAAQSSSTTTTTLPELVVSERAEKPEAGYSTNRATSATKTDTPIMETPASIQVVPREVIEDQNTPRVKDALENVSGVRPQPSLGTGANFIIRGFPNGNRIYRNGLGLINGFGGLDTELDTANVENIEVLKGPAAMLYGRIEPGGLININTKRPLAQPYYSLEQQFGSYSLYRTQWDATGPLLQDRSLLYRFTGAYHNSGSFRDFSSTDRLLVNPSFTWRPTKAIELTLDVEGLDQDFKADFGIPVIGKRPAPIPISRSLDDPNTPLANLSHILLNTEFTYHLNDFWALRNRFLALYENNHSTFVNPAPAFGDALQADNRTLDRNIFYQRGSTEAYTTNLDLTGQVQVWRTRHDILVGFDFTQSYSRYHTQGDFINPNPALAIDIFNPGPSYGIPSSLFKSTLATSVLAPFDYSLAKIQWYGVYFQDQITLWDKLHILGGGRYDWAETGRGRGASFSAAGDALPASIQHDDEFSPRVGVLYQAWPWLSVYGNWTTSFGANNGVSATGHAQPPETGEQYEAGLKTAWFDERLGTTLAFYHLTKQNILTADLSTSDPFDSIAIGEARSRGIEFDTTGQITDSLSLIGSYAYTDTRVTKDSSGLQGKRLSQVPEHSGSLWVKYDFTKYHSLSGLSLGCGIYVVDRRQGDADNTFQLPGYVRLDAFASYSRKVGSAIVTAQFNIRNLLDEKYYESSDAFYNVAPRLGVYPGAPLTAIGLLRVEY